MKTAKVIYGRSIMEKAFWAYGVGVNGKVALVRCETAMDAVEEKDRMKNSNAKTVGHTTRAISEADMRVECRNRGWKIEVIR